MNTLAQDETDVEIGNAGRQNEIGQMARALQKFRENIINKRKVEAEILDLAMTDTLTELGNRHRFEQRLKETIATAERSKTSVACMMVDLDRFKPINDELGHAAGDEVLRMVAKRLLHVTRKTDFVARLGGDEFVILSTDISDFNSVEISAKRIVDQLGLPMYLEEGNVQIGGSVGISIYPIDTIDVDELVKNADKALYAAKEAGRNTFQFYNASMN